MASVTPRVIQVKLDITLDDRKFYNAPENITTIAQQIAQAAIAAVDDSPAAVRAESVDVEWAWIYAWAAGSMTVAGAAGVDLDPEGVAE
ncbi:hypothetical protein [Cellulomonas sp. HZM]|uniref:hypothetical protein n=1 Tax=Cellulomonas sp. HZM TaxID=1454010 RepID=UPI000492EC78|nr:hypothetical protein [Cellulomonas sp. HZM]